MGNCCITKNYWTMNKITKEDLKKRQAGLTVGGLKKFLLENNPPDDAPVLIQRVEDKYFEGVDISGIGGCKSTKNGIYPPGSKATGWGVYLKRGEHYFAAENFNKEMNEEIKRRANGEEPEYDIEDPSKFIVKLDEGLMEQYSPAWCCVGYKDDPDILFIDLHY